MCDILRPPEGVYSVTEQARMQFLSVLLVATGLMKPGYRSQLGEVVYEDFEVGVWLGTIFRPLLIWLRIGQVLHCVLCHFDLRYLLLQLDARFYLTRHLILLDYVLDSWSCRFVDVGRKSPSQD